MARADKDFMGQPRPARPHTHGSIDATHLMLGFLLLLIGIAAIIGVVVAISSGQPTVAIIIGVVAAAFFSRVLC